MDKGTLRTVGLVLAGLAVVGAIWGLVDHPTSADSQGRIEETHMWIAITFLLLALANVVTLLSLRDRGPDRPE